MFDKHITFSFLASLVATAALVACGGGGDAATTEFAYRWAPILYGDREALLSMAAQKAGAPPVPGQKNTPRRK